jgi:ParB family chromosome partitioning protein
MQIQIDEQFRTEIDPLTREERVALECSILEYGCRDALVVWGDTLVDGHNRYEICTEYDVPYRIMHMDFESRDHALLWINNNQDARRNQTPAQRIDRQLRKKEILERIGRSRIAESNEKRAAVNPTLSIIDKVDLDEEAEAEAESEEVIPHNTRAQIAEAAGVSTGTIAMAEIAKRDAPEVWQMAKEGKASINESYKAAKLDPEEQAEVVRQVEEGESKTVSEAIKKVVHVSQNSGNNEWYTPSEYIEAAREVMGGIDLDPASSEIANCNVKAAKFYTEEDNGLDQEWAGRVWMNPPYERGLCDKFMDVLATCVESGDVEAAIVLVNNATDTKWFARGYSASSAACFPTGRIKFLAPDGSSVGGDVEGFATRKGGPLQGQAILYMGSDPDRFCRAFEKFGCVFTTWRCK